MSTKLNDQQKRFCKEYLIDLNKTQAAIRAGYSKKTAKEQGYENLTKPHIQKAIQKAFEKRANKLKLEVNAERVVIELARLAFYEMNDFYKADGKLKPIKDLSENARHVLAGITVNAQGVMIYKLPEKTRALELLGRHLAMFTDNLKIGGDLATIVAKMDPETAKKFLSELMGGN